VTRLKTNRTARPAAGILLLMLSAGCGHQVAPTAVIPASGAAAATPVAATPGPDVPVAINGPEMTQSVPPPPQVAANPNAVEIVHKLPPVPASVSHRHKRLHLVKYENRYWLEDVDHHCYVASRDHAGHYYPACYESAGGGTVYPLYYDSARDDYYRACSDHNHHHFRCYEDEPDYVYYYDPDPVYVSNGNGWNPDCEAEVDAPAYSAGWGASIPLFGAALFVFPAWHSQWWVGGGWSGGGDTFVDISFGRPYFNYYAVPSEYPFVYANTLYVSNPTWRTNPGWYQHAQFDQTAYQNGSYRSFSGYGHAVAAGTLAASYSGYHAFHSGAGAVRPGTAHFAAATRRPGAGSFGHTANTAEVSHTVAGHAAGIASARYQLHGHPAAGGGSFTANHSSAAAHTAVESKAVRSERAQQTAHAIHVNANRTAAAQRSTAAQRGSAAAQHRNAAVQRANPAARRTNIAAQRSHAAAQRKNAATHLANSRARQSNPGAELQRTQRSNPAPQHRNPAPRRTSPAPHRSNPAPLRGNPAPHRSNPAPRPSDPAPRRGNPAPQRSNPAPQRTGGGGGQRGGEARPPAGRPDRRP